MSSASKSWHIMSPHTCVSMLLYECMTFECCFRGFVNKNLGSLYTLRASVFNGMPAWFLFVKTYNTFFIKFCFFVSSLVIY